MIKLDNIQNIYRGCINYYEVTKAITFSENETLDDYGGVIQSCLNSLYTNSVQSP